MPATINYCDTIKFDIGEFDSKILKTASDKGDCRLHPIPLALRIGDKILRAKIDLWEGGLVIPSEFIMKNDSSAVDGPYKLNEELVKNSIKQWPMYKKIKPDQMTIEMQFLSTETEAGIAFIKKIKFTQADGTPGPMIADYAFSKDERYAATYSTGFISQDDVNAQLMMRAMKKLFLSMRIDW